MITTNRIITNRFKLEIQSKKAKWTQTAGSVDWTEFLVDWPCAWKFSRFRKLSVSSFSRLNRVFSRLNHAWKLSGSRFSRLNRVFSRLNHAWAVFQPYSNEEQTLPKCNRTNIGSKGLCQSATRPYMLLDASPKAWSNIRKRISHKFDSKAQKLEYSQNQSKSRANAHEEVLGIHTQQPKIIIVIDVR